MQKFFFKKFGGQNLKIFFLAFAVAAGYLYFLNAVKTDHYRLFNVKKTITWAQAQNSIFRVISKDNIENILLSEDGWRDYALSLSIANPKDCGLIFDYLDLRNYGFVYFQKNPGVIISGRFKDGRTEVEKTVPFKFSVSPVVLLKKEGGEISLQINNRLLFQQRSERPAGKVGLMLNAANNPPTVFYHIAIKRWLDHGQFVENLFSSSPGTGMAGSLRSFLPFYFIFILLIYCVALIKLKAGSFFPAMEERAVIIRSAASRV